MAAPRATLPVAMPVIMPAPRGVPVAMPVARPAPVIASPVAASAAVAASSVAHVPAPVSPGLGEEVPARLILDMPATRAFKLVDGHKTLKEVGTLQVMSSALEVEGQEEVYIVVLGKMRLALRQHVPCLEMAPRNFVFPTGGEGGKEVRTYGVVIADTITEDVLEVFRLLLVEHTSFRVAAEPTPIVSLPDRADRVVSTAHSVAAGLGAGSVVVATGVIKGGRMVGELITKGGVALTHRLKPNEVAGTVSEKTKGRLQKAKLMSGTAVSISKALVIGAVATTDALSKQLSEALKDTSVGKKLASDPAHPNERLDAAKQVGSATIGAVLHVYQAIGMAVWGVARDASAATVTVVRHKYGEEYGHHTEEGLGVAGDVAQAASSVRSIGLKTVAKRTAIKTSQELLATPAERAAAAEAAKSSAESRGIGASLGLPENMDPLQAAQAVQAVATLSAVAAPLMAAAAAHVQQPGERVTVTTAVATGSTPARAHAAASAAAQAASEK